jgi:hypothetical protein
MYLILKNLTTWKSRSPPRSRGKNKSRNSLNRDVGSIPGDLKLRIQPGMRIRRGSGRFCVSEVFQFWELLLL